MEKIDEIKSILESMDKDIEKLEKKGMRSPATRIRKGLMAIAKLCKVARQEVQEMKKVNRNKKCRL